MSDRPQLLFVVESGSDARLVAGLAEGFELRVLARRITEGVEISHLPAGSAALTVGPASRLGFAWLVLKTVLASAPPDLVLVQGYGPAALAANLAGRVRHVRTSMLVCSPVEHYYRCRRAHPQADKPFRRRELWAMLLVARLNALVGRQYVVLSRHLEEVVRGHGARRVAVAPVYGVDAEVFQPSAEPRAALRERLGLPRTGALVFYSSRVAPEKDAETLLAALGRLLAEGRDLWLLHRSGGHREFLERAEGFGVAARVVATDAVDPHGQLPDDYRAADLCVQASREEGLGFSPLEALACGTPVVAAAVGGLRETIRDGETGWSYPAGDAAALARCIAAALDDRAEAARRTANGRALVQAHYERGDAFERLRAALTGERAVNREPRSEV